MAMCGFRFGPLQGCFTAPPPSLHLLFKQNRRALAEMIPDFLHEPPHGVFFDGGQQS